MPPARYVRAERVHIGRDSDDPYSVEGHEYVAPTELVELIVTRHPALVELIIERGLATPETPVLTHAGPDDVKNKRVAGVLPHSLSVLCSLFVEIPLRLAPEDRGQELTIERMREIAGGTVKYAVSEV